jgi:hypothetical protein
VREVTDCAGAFRFENERKLELDGLAGTHTIHGVV